MAVYFIRGLKMLRILIADDHEIVRHGMRRVIEQNPGWEVCAEAEDGQAAVALALREKPNIVVLDVSLPILNGLTVARRLHQELPGSDILMFSMHDDEETINGALAAGARGYILKTDCDQHLTAAIKALAARRPYFSPFVTELILDAAVNDRKKSLLESFTVRELEVAQQVAEGKSNKFIARHLNISVKTVESHRAAAMRKAGVHSGPEFVRFAIRHNLIKA